MKLFKNLFNASKRAVDYDRMKENNRFIFGHGKKAWRNIKGVQQPGAMQPGLSLTEEQIAQYGATYKKVIFAFVVATFGVLVYLIYSFMHHDYQLVILNLAFLLVCGAYIFKYHYLLFQLKHPDHYITPKEWLDAVLRRKS